VEYDPIKSEETDDEDCKDTNTTNSQNLLPIINIKEESKVKAEEDEASTDDELSPEGLVSWIIGYDPVKSEETDEEELGEDIDTSKSNEQHLLIKVKAEVKTEDDVSTDDECNSENKPVKTPAQPNSIQEDESTQHMRKKKRSRSKRKREEVEESNRSVQKTARMECSVDGCTRKAADSGTCKKKHKGYNYCRQDGCTKRVQKEGVCIKHGAKVKTCSYDGCTSNAQKGGVCKSHGAVVKRKTCSHEGCTNKARGKEGVCIKHGAKQKMKATCNHEGCSNKAQSRGLCDRHGRIKSR